MQGVAGAGGRQPWTHVGRGGIWVLENSLGGFIAESSSLFFKRFIYFWLFWVFLAAWRLSPVVVIRGYTLLRCSGFSLQWFLLLQSTGSKFAGFSSCGTQALSLWGMWDSPRPGIKCVSPALAGVFLTTICHCCSVAVVSDTLQPHGLQHARLPCPSLSPGVCSHSCPLSWWCHPTISSSAAFFSCSQLPSLTTRPPGKPQKHFF